MQAMTDDHLVVACRDGSLHVVTYSMTRAPAVPTGGKASRHFTRYKRKVLAECLWSHWIMLMLPCALLGLVLLQLLAMPHEDAAGKCSAGIRTTGT